MTSLALIRLGRLQLSTCEHLHHSFVLSGKAWIMPDTERPITDVRRMRVQGPERVIAAFNTKLRTVAGPVLRDIES